MRWQTGRRSDNIEDRRNARLDGRSIRGQRPMGIGRKVGAGGGLGGLILIVLLLVLGVDPTLLLSDLGQPSPPQTPVEPRPSAPVQDERADFVSVVLADTEDTWNAIFEASGKRYAPPTLVLFTGMTRSACGLGQSAMGPFYCPADRKVYIDLAFYDELRDSLGAPGDFAQAYVIAHEIGHHVQNLLGISAQVAKLSARSGQTETNALSVRQELQADCFAGVWANRADRAREILERGDVEEGLNAASAIGDDRLQRQSRGTVIPDSFTHGSSAQRMRWFERGLQTGQVSACDTFTAERL